MDRRHDFDVATALDEIRLQLDPADRTDVVLFLHLEDVFPLPRGGMAPGGVPDGVRDLLGSLVPLATVVVLGDRDREVVANALALEGVTTVGSGGLEIAGPDGLSFEHADARLALPELATARQMLNRDLTGLDSVRVRLKKYAIELAFRGATRAERRTIRATALAIRDHCARLRVERRRARITIRPHVQWNVRMAILWILEGLGGRSRQILPIYLGRHPGGLRAVLHLGVGISVGRIPWRATPHFRFRKEGDVERFLKSLCGLLKASARQEIA